MSSDTPKRNEIKDGMTRRSFIQLLQLTGLGAFVGMNSAFGQMKPKVHGGLRRSAHPLKGRLVHVHDSDATSWNFSTGWYGDYVDQVVVDNMVEAGLLELTGAGDMAGAWHQLVPDYEPGKTFAIKLNFNNFQHSGPDPDPDINAMIEPVNALIRSLVAFGVMPRDIYVYDVTNGYHSGSMPQNSFIQRCLYLGVNFVYHYGNPDPYSSTEVVEFNPPSSPNIPDLAIANVVVDSDYLINMFVCKAHSMAGVTLGFKNHMGSYNQCQAIHDYLPSSYYYKPQYSPLIDVFKNKHFGPKTVLTMGDGLYGNWKSLSGKPLRWNTFGSDAMNSLFFAADPVAIDSVVIDYIDLERKSQGYSGVIKDTRTFLTLAEKERWGIHESADPWALPIGSDYKRIEFSYIDGV